MGMFSPGTSVTVKCRDTARMGTQVELKVARLVGTGAQAAAWLMEPWGVQLAAVAGGGTGTGAKAAGTASAAGGGTTAVGLEEAGATAGGGEGKGAGKAAATAVAGIEAGQAAAPRSSSGLAPLTSTTQAAAAPSPKPLPDKLVLKVGLPEAALPPSKRSRYAPGQWLLSGRLMCTQEFQALDALAKSSWVLDCYGCGTVQLSTGEEMPCLLLEYAPWGVLNEQLVGEDGQPQGLEPELCRMVVDFMIQALTPPSPDVVFVHRDIKPANIMLCNPPPGSKAGRFAPWVAKLGDWGISKQLTASQSLATTVAFTPAYQAPEMRPGAYHDRRVDTWCLGCLLLHLWAGRLPFWYLWEDEGVSKEECMQRRSGKMNKLSIS